MNQQEYAERMKDPHYKALEITRHDNPEGKDYVFISYRGNSWKKVLSGIVYRLQTEYGLRVYFDKDFANETNVWVEQFQQNMDTSHCKAFLCFFDEGYVTSYATLLELMHAMNKKSNLSDKIYSINFSIDWDRLSDQDYDTGLGKEDAGNPGWKREKDAFDKEFKLLRKKSGYEEIEEYYGPEQATPLRACDCKNIMSIIQPKNQRQYADEKDFYEQFIINPLKAKTKTGQYPEGSVFERLCREPEDVIDDPADPPVVIFPENPPLKSLPLKSFLKMFNHNNFNKSTFSKIKITGTGESAKYSTDYYESTYDLVWSFVMEVLKENPDYISQVNAKHSKVKNPVFLLESDYRNRTKEEQRKYRQIELAGFEDWYMYRHFSQYGWMDTVLKIRIQDMGLSLDSFTIEYEGENQEVADILKNLPEIKDKSKKKGLGELIHDY